MGRPGNQRRHQLHQELTQAASSPRPTVGQVASLDAPALPGGESAGSIGDLIGAEDPGLEHAVDIDAACQHCAGLPSREQRQLMMMMRFYGNMTQDQISAELGISQMHVSRLLARALRYLREQLIDAGRPVPG
jgi:RNA polymerase sigma-B factor